MSNEVTPLESLLYGNFIRYDRLREMTNECFQGSNADNVNIYIDLYSILSPLRYRNGEFVILNYSVVTSAILNLCAHLRGFYNDHYRVNTKIFLVYSDNTPEYNTSACYGYNAMVREAIANNPVVDDLIRSNLKLLGILTPYLYDIHFIENNWETGVVIYDLILKEASIGNTNPNIIYSKDQYLYQLPALLSNTVLFRPKKGNGDISWYINQDTALVTFTVEGRKVDPTKCVGLNPKLLSLLMTLSNLPCRGLKSLFNISTALKLLQYMVSEMAISNDHCKTIGNVYNYIANTRPVGRADISYTKDMFCGRYDSIDIPTQHIIYSTRPDRVIEYGLNLYDPDAVRDINNKYFKENPLDLNRL